MRVRDEWYVPGHVPDYNQANTEEEALETITLIVFNDAETKDNDYVPVFESINDCDKFVRNLAEEHQDLAFAVCSFPSLNDVRERVKFEFNRSVKLVVKESPGEVQNSS